MSNIICVDLGASSTRVATTDLLVHEIPNNVRVVPMGEDIHMQSWDSATYEESVLNMLDVTIRRHEGSNYFLPEEQRLLIGTIADRYGSSSRPTGMEPKHKQTINYQNAVVATAFQLLMSPGMTASATAGQPVPVVVFVALPPIECKGNEKIFQDTLKGTYTVKFNSLDTQVTFSVTEVKCNAESLLSLMHFFFEPNVTPRSMTAKYMTGNSLSLDIGASTTDLAAMQTSSQGVKYIEKSGVTFQIGGNQIRDYVMNEIQMRFGYTPTISEADYVVKTGNVRVGAKEVDFSKELRHAKEEFAIQLIDRLNGYFKMINMSLASFMCIAISGGGSLHSCIGEGDSMKVTTPALSEIIMNEIHRYCNTVDVIAVPGNPRHANINGLLVFAQTWDNRRRQMEQRSQAIGNLNNGAVNAQTGNGATNAAPAGNAVQMGYGSIPQTK